MEYAHAMGDGKLILLDDFTPELRGEAPPGTELTVRDEERQRILDTLSSVKGSRRAAAEHLGISRATLWRKMREDRRLKAKSGPENGF